MITDRRALDEFERLLERPAQALEGQGIAYMVIGGQAVLRYGEPRLTRDIDVTLGVGADRLPEVMRIVSSLGLSLLVKDPASLVARTMALPVAAGGGDRNRHPGRSGILHLAL